MTNYRAWTLGTFNDVDQIVASSTLRTDNYLLEVNYPRTVMTLHAWYRVMDLCHHWWPLANALCGGDRNKEPALNAYLRSEYRCPVRCDRRVRWLSTLYTWFYVICQIIVARRPLFKKIRRETRTCGVVNELYSTKALRVFPWFWKLDRVNEKYDECSKSILFNR